MLKLTKPLYFIFFSFLVIFTGCVKNEVKVEFKLPDSVNDAYRMVYYASDPVKGWYVEMVAVLQKGKAEMILPTRYPAIVFIMHGGGSPVAAFYAERGDKMLITGDGPNPYTWKISGNKLTDSWSEWRLANRSVLSSGDAAKINKAVTEYVTKNPENPLSAIFLSMYYDRNEDEPGFTKAWNKLKGDALKPKWADLVSRNDMVEGAPLFPDNVTQIVFNSVGSGADTLETAKQPAILYFWRRDDPDRTEAIAMLKRLSEDFPDSAGRFIADISFETDSLYWRSTIRPDSLRKTVRAWNPLGEVDSLFSRLGVSRTPMFIVFDKNGHPQYKGNDIGKAETSFRERVKNNQGH